jgi:hypothetical protein
VAGAIFSSAPDRGWGSSDMMVLWQERCPPSLLTVSYRTIGSQSSEATADGPWPATGQQSHRTTYASSPRTTQTPTVRNTPGLRQRRKPSAVAPHNPKHRPPNHTTPSPTSTTPSTTQGGKGGQRSRPTDYPALPSLYGRTRSPPTPSAKLWESCQPTTPPLN